MAENGFICVFQKVPPYHPSPVLKYAYMLFFEKYALYAHKFYIFDDWMIGSRGGKGRLQVFTS